MTRRHIKRKGYFRFGEWSGKAPEGHTPMQGPDHSERASPESVCRRVFFQTELGGTRAPYQEKGRKELILRVVEPPFPTWVSYLETLLPEVRFSKPQH